MARPRWARRAWHDVRELALAHARRVVKARQVVRVRGNGAPESARIVATLVVKDEAPRFPFLLEYYRRAGVEHFFVIDNGSSDGLEDMLRTFPDVTYFHADGAYGSSRYGNDWINHVASTYCAGRWVLYIDADEFLVTSHTPLDLNALCDGLERSGQRALHSVMIDMYSDRPASLNVVAAGTDPLDVCPLYDSDGYQGFFDPLTGTTWIKGGVRARLFFDDIHAGPALNKTPLVRWRRWYAFVQSAHRLAPSSLNRQHPHVQGALLHFKFTSTSAARLVDHSNRAQHTEEYRAYDGVEATAFVGTRTARFESAKGLVDKGLISSLE